MKNIWKTWWVYAVAAVVVITAVVGGVVIFGGNNDDGSPLNVAASTRYEAKPYMELENDVNKKVKYSYVYEDYEIYFIYLGEMANIPIYYPDLLSRCCTTYRTCV